MDKMDLDQKIKLTGESKRQFLRGFSAFVGSITAVSLLGSQAITVAMAYMPNTQNVFGAGKIFSSSELILLKSICAIVIPATDTPGAAEVDVHGFIDNQLYNCHDVSDQKRILVLLDKIEQQSIKRYQQPFSQANTGEQFQLLTEVESGQNVFNKDNRADFKFLKGLIAFGYYTSEIGATQELHYQAIPGGFKGSIPYSDVGSSWGSKAYY